MGNSKCATLVDGKSCGLELALIDQDIDSELEIYECPLGHRKHLLLGEMIKGHCPGLVAGKACGLALNLVEQDHETATEIYECALGHRIYAPMEPEAFENSS